MSAEEMNPGEFENLETVRVTDNSGPEPRLERYESDSKSVRFNSRNPPSDTKDQDYLDVNSLLIDGGGQITYRPNNSELVKERLDEDPQGEILSPESFYEEDGSYSYDEIGGAPDTLVIDRKVFEGEYEETVSQMMRDHEGETIVIGQESYNLLEGVEATDRDLKVEEAEQILNGNTEVIESTNSYLDSYKQVIDDVHGQLAAERVESTLGDDNQSPPYDVETALDKALEAKNDLAYLEAINKELNRDRMTDQEIGKQIRYAELGILILDDLVQKEAIMRESYTHKEAEMMFNARREMKKEIIENGPLYTPPKPHNIDNNIDIREELNNLDINPEMGSVFQATSF